jgi:hypothetical protein
LRFYYYRQVNFIGKQIHKKGYTQQKKQTSLLCSSFDLHYLCRMNHREMTIEELRTKPEGQTFDRKSAKIDTKSLAVILGPWPTLTVETLPLALRTMVT